MGAVRRQDGRRGSPWRSWCGCIGRRALRSRRARQSLWVSYAIQPDDGLNPYRAQCYRVALQMATQGVRCEAGIP